MKIGDTIIMPEPEKEDYYIFGNIVEIEGDNLFVEDQEGEVFMIEKSRAITVD